MSNRDNGLTDALRGALAGMAGGLATMAMRNKVVPKAMPKQMQPDAFAPKEAVKWAEEKANQPNRADASSLGLKAYRHYRLIFYGGLDCF